MYRVKHAVNTSARSLRRRPSPAGISPRSPKSTCSSPPGGPSSTGVVTLLPPAPHRPHHRHDLPDQLIGELLLTAPAGQASRHRGHHIPPAGLAVNTGLRGHRPLALPREPGPQRLTDLD